MTAAALALGDYLDRTREDALRLAELLDQRGPLLAVPTCPGWSTGQLVRHLGAVHRWAAEYVARAITDMVPEPKEADQIRAGPPDPQLARWLVEGAELLVGELAAAPADLQCWTFLAAPTPLLFWARRQAHETAIHRVDGEVAAEAPPTPLPSRFAADGVDELLLGFGRRRRRRLTRAAPASILLRAADAERRWQVATGPDGLVVGEGEAPSCAVTASASDLYLLLWNRRDLSGLAVEGEPALLRWWSQEMRVTWE